MMNETTTGRQKEFKETRPPDKLYYILNKLLDIYGKCNKKCTSKGEAIQCDPSCVCSTPSVRALHGINIQSI